MQSMDECDVRFTRYVRNLMERRGLTTEDETLIAAVLRAEPLKGRIVLSHCPALRALDYEAINDGSKHDVFYVFFPNSDVQINGRDIALVVAVNDHDSFSGQRFEPESVLRIMEMVAEITRYVLT